jgi:hypothetical protein
MESPRERDALLKETTEICGLAAAAGDKEDATSKTVTNADIKPLTFRDMPVLLMHLKKRGLSASRSAPSVLGESLDFYWK